MLRNKLLLIAFLFLSSIAYASDTIDGLTGEEFEVTQWDGLPAAPSVSPTNTARIYYNGISDTLKLSVNGGAYSDLITALTGGATYLTLDQSTPQTITASPIFDWGTATRIPFYSAIKTLTDSVGLTFDDTNKRLNIVQNTTDVSHLTGTAVAVVGADNAPTRFGISSFGIAGLNAFACRHARNTATSPQAVQNGDQLFSLEGWGYGATGYSVAPKVMVRGYANETWTDAAQGSYLSLWTTPLGTIVPARQWSVLNDGSLVSGLDGTANKAVTTAGDGSFGIVKTNNYQNAAGTASFVWSSPAWFTDNGITTTSTLSFNNADWTGGNVVYVPLTGDIQTYITAATAGDTLVLAAGTYTITSGITVNKLLHIRGQGAGITTIACSTDNVDMVTMASAGSVISDITISKSGAMTTSTKFMVLATANCEINNIQFLNTCTGGAISSHGVGATSGTAVINIRNCSYSGTGAIGGHTFLRLVTAGTPTINAYNCIGSASGATSATFGLLNEISVGTLNCYDCSFSSATNLVEGIVQVTGGAINCYNCTINGSGATAFDVRQTGGTLTLYNTTLVNNKTSGTITYGGTVRSTRFTAGNAGILSALSAGDDKNVQIYHNDTDVKLDSSSGNFIFNKVQRTSTSLYRRYYHIPLAATNPGASGATWVSPSANKSGGWNITSATQVLEGQSDVHADWDGASDPKFELRFATNVDNTGGADTDTVDLRMVIYYKGIGDTSTKTQTVEVATVIGKAARYKQFKVTFPVNYDEVGNVLDAGDIIGFILNLETDTSEVDNIIVADMSFSYLTTHTYTEDGDE